MTRCGLTLIEIRPVRCSVEQIFFPTNSLCKSGELLLKRLASHTTDISHYIVNEYTLLFLRERTVAVATEALLTHFVLNFLSGLPGIRKRVSLEP